jgi:hypothetical protein
VLLLSAVSCFLTVAFKPRSLERRLRTTPELSYLQARCAGPVSYGLSADLLNEILPLGRTPHVTAVRRQAQATAQHLEDELDDGRPGFITGRPAEWAELPRPDLPSVVGRGGGDVHSCTQRTRRDGWFEVIAGKAMPADGRSSCSGTCTPTTANPNGGRSKYSPPRECTSQSAGHLPHRRRRRHLPACLATSIRRPSTCWTGPPHDADAQLAQLAKGLRCPPETSTNTAQELQRVKWFLWHGNVFRARHTSGFVLDATIAVLRGLLELPAL